MTPSKVATRLLASVHPDIIQFHILSRLDGAALASTSCASVRFQSLCSDDQLWQHICNSTWPSTAHPHIRNAVSAFPSAHRSFYSDSFPSLHNCQGKPCPSDTSELISAVDIFYDNNPVYSKVLRTETRSSWFRGSPFRLELLGPEETVQLGACGECDRERVRVSWIVIDPGKKRAVNVASQKAVEARVQWLNEELQLRYARVTSDGGGNPVQLGLVVKCGGREVKEVSMLVEDIEGKIVGGKESLVILGGAMDGERRRLNVEMEMEMYEMFWKKKQEVRERKQRRERGLDLVFIASIFFLIFIFLHFSFFSG